MRIRLSVERLENRDVPSCIGIAPPYGPVLISPMDPAAGGGSLPPVQVPVQVAPTGSFPPAATRILMC
jgi:hypothetical protein